MKKTLFITLLFLINMSIFAQKQTIKDLNTAKEISKKVSSFFVENKIEEAFGLLTPYWPLPQNEIDGVQNKTIKYLNMFQNRFGKPIGSVKVKEQHILDIIIRETYLIRFEFTAIRLQFTYYKNDKGWIVNAFKWDDTFSEEFE